MEEPKTKPKMTNEELLAEVSAMIKIFREEMEIFKKEFNEKKAEIPAMTNVSTGEFIIDGYIKHFSISPERQKEFFQACAKLMREYGVFNAVVSVNKRF